MEACLNACGFVVTMVAGFVDTLWDGCGKAETPNVRKLNRKTGPAFAALVTAKENGKLYRVAKRTAGSQSIHEDPQASKVRAGGRPRGCCARMRIDLASWSATGNCGGPPAPRGGTDLGIHTRH